MTKDTYKEGDWFAVPLPKGGYATGRIARMKKGSPVLFGYFFGPREERIPQVGNLEKYSPENAVAKFLFGDLNLHNGEWPLVGESSTWERAEWPIPAFVRTEPISNRKWRVIYSDDDPTKVITEQLISDDMTNDLQKDSLLGAGAVEMALDKLL